MLKLKYNSQGTTQKYYSKIIKSYKNNQDNFSKKSKELLEPEAVNVDADDMPEDH